MGNKKIPIDEIEHHYFLVDGMLIRITTRTKGWIIPGKITADPSNSRPDEEETETVIIAVDIKSSGEWTCFDETLRKAQQWHGMSLGEAERSGMDMAKDLPAYQLYETARMMIEEGKYFGAHIEEVPEYDIPKGDRL